MNNSKFKLITEIIVTCGNLENNTEFNVEKVLNDVNFAIKSGADVLEIKIVDPEIKPLNNTNVEKEILNIIIPQIINITKSSETEICISVDTEELAEFAFSNNIKWIHDLTSLTSHDGINVAKMIHKSNSTVILNYIKPEFPCVNPDNDENLVKKIVEVGIEKVEFLKSCGVNINHIIFDPLVLRSNDEEYLNILKSINSFKKIGCKLCLSCSVSHSVAKALGLLKSSESPIEDAMLAIFLYSKGVHVLRVKAEHITAVKHALEVLVFSEEAK